MPQLPGMAPPHAVCDDRPLVYHTGTGYSKKKIDPIDNADGSKINT